MSTSHREDLSALIDGALGKSEAAFLLRRLEHDAELRGTFARYHLIRDCLRGGHGNAMPAPAALAERVREAVAKESAPGRPLPWQGGLRWAAGFFTAAVVAASAFWYVQPREPAGALSADAANPAAGASEVVASGVRADDLRRQLPLLPVAARQSRPLAPGEFAPQPDPEAWQRAPVAPLYYPSTHYIIVLPAPRGDDVRADAGR